MPGKSFWKSFCRVVGGVSLVGVCGGAALANNVQVALEGQLLVVRGDNVANNLLISQNALGTIVLRGRNGTTVNGRASVTLRNANLNAAEIRMEGGNDILALSGLSPANDLYINLGAGNDSLVSSNPATVGANCMIEGDLGNDTINLRSLTVNEDLYIDGGVGALTATVADFMGGKGVTVVSDQAADRVTLTNIVAADAVTVETKGGNDRVTVNGAVALAVLMATDAGADVVSLSNAITAEDVGVFTGTENDVVTLVDVDSGKSLTVSVDDGSDSVTGDGVSVAEDAVFEGGNGLDVLRDFGIVAGIKKDIKEFETILP